MLLLVALLAPSLAPAETVSLAYASGSIRLRKGPGTNYATVGYLKNGNYIDVLSKGSIWSKVQTSSGKVGYIKNLYISGIGGNYADGTTYYGGHISGTVRTQNAGSTVNLRSGASTSTAIIARLARGTKIKILGENGSWYLVSTSSGTQGYMSKTYVSTSGSASIASTARVTGSVVNLRKGPGTSYGIITGLSRNTRVTILSTANAKWWKVQYGSYVGYMSSNYLAR